VIVEIVDPTKLRKDSTSVTKNPFVISLDFGASKFVCMSSTRKYLKTPIGVTCHGILDVDETPKNFKQVSMTSPANINLHQVIGHLKHKFPFVLHRGILWLMKEHRDRAMKVQLRYHEATDENIEKIFAEILSLLLKAEFNTMQINDENPLPPDQVFLISIPNTYSMVQKHYAEIWWKKDLETVLATYNWENFKWCGKIYLYSEASSALCGMMSDFPTFENFVVIDQGDSTTNIATCIAKIINGKKTYQITEYGLRIGGIDYTRAVLDLAMTIARLTPRGRPYDFHIVQLCMCEIDELKEKLFKKLNGSEVDEITVEFGRWRIELVPDKIFRTTCANLDARICNFIKSSVENSRDWFARVILCGGGMKNPILVSKIEKMFVRGSIAGSIVTDENANPLVCYGLIRRHEVQQNVHEFGIEELTPYSYYIIPGNEVGLSKGTKATLVCILKKGSPSDSIQIAFDATADQVDFHIYQVDCIEDSVGLNEDIVPSGSLDGKTMGGGQLMLQPIGSVKFNTKSLRSSCIEPAVEPEFTTKYSNGRLDISLTYNGKKIGEGIFTAESVGNEFEIGSKTFDETFKNLEMNHQYRK
jgi:hypothetical protein